MAEETLIVRMAGRPVGELKQNEHGLLSFDYLTSWREAADGYAISLSMPLPEGPFDKNLVEAYFGGGLPDDAEARERIAESFHVSPNSLFQLLKAIGREFPGAVSLHPADERPADEIAPSVPTTYLDESALATELRALKRTPLLAGPRKLRLSLAGAQSKTGLYVSGDGDMALPLHTPSTHIIKPELDDRFPDLILIEYYCLRLAERLGLEVPPTTYGTAEGIPYLLIERYDRVRDEEGRVRRLHQEDFCQALGIRTRDKYEKRGGPGLADCFLRVIDRLDAPARDRLRLLDAVIFNYLIGNTDAHGKNFSILHTDDGLRLAPFYDLVSTLIYADDAALDMDTEMAMRIGTKYDASLVMARHWQVFAKACRLGWPAVKQRLEAKSREVQIEAILLERELSDQGLQSPVFRRAVGLILRSALLVRQALQFPRIPDEELPERCREARLEASLLPKYRRFMAELAANQRRARLAGDSATGAELSRLGRRLVRAFNRWRDGPDFSEDDRRLLEEHLGEVPAANR